MRRTGRVLTLAALAGVVSAGTVEAARFEFNGAGRDGGIIWDNGSDVRTMNNDCGADPAACFTSLVSTLPQNFGVLLTSSDLANVFVTSVTLLLSAPSLPADCGAITCTTATAFAADVNNPLWSGFTDQPVALLPTIVSPDNAALYLLTAASSTFLSTLDSSILGQSFLGFYLNFTTTDNVPFIARVVEVTSTPVPEPATLALLALGAAAAARRSMKRRPLAG